MYINPFFLSHFLITNSRLSLSNTEIVCADHVKLWTFLGHCLQLWSCDWSKFFNSKIHPLRVKFKNIFFRKLPFCRFMHSLRKNENISMWGKRIAPQQNKLLPFLPGSLLNALCSFWSVIGYGFRGNYRVNERIYRFNSKWVREKEKHANSKWIWRIFLFAL